MSILLSDKQLEQNQCIDNQKWYDIEQSLNNISLCFENTKKKFAEKYQEGSSKDCCWGKLMSGLLRILLSPRPKMTKTGLIKFR